MSDLDRAIELVIQGDKENAMRQLASLLMRNKDEVEAWMLLGELIGDPSKKKDCYKQVLRLSPSSRYALKKLQELEPPPPIEPAAIVSTDEEMDTRPSIRPLRQSENPAQNSYPPGEHSRSGPELVAYVIGGIAVILVIVYVTTSVNNLSDGTDNPSGNIGNLFAALLFVSLIAIMIILSVSDRNRG
jgi:hypothetical protein